MDKAMDKVFVLDNFNIVLDKKYFVRADGRGINLQSNNFKKTLVIDWSTLFNQISPPFEGLYQRKPSRH